MKKIILFFTIFSFAFSFAQKTNTRDYEDINARLDRLLREREVEKRVLNVNLEGKTLLPKEEYLNLTNLFISKAIKCILKFEARLA